MTLIEKGNPYKECYMYIDGYVKSSTRECQQLGALGMRQQFNTQNAWAKSGMRYSGTRDPSDEYQISMKERQK